MRDHRPLRPLAAMLSLISIMILSIAAANAGKSEVEMQRHVESSLLVRGTIDITADGDVVGYALDTSDKIPPGIADMVARLAPQWRFEPIPLPNNAIGRTDMHLLFVASTLESGDYRVELRNVSFSTDRPPQERLTIARRGRPVEYPPDLNAMAVGGTVYVEVQVGRDGKVINLGVSKVNLTTVGSETEMAKWRTQLTAASIKAVRGWRFAPPTAGVDVGALSWNGTLPISFSRWNEAKSKPGRWQTYIPGPRNALPWLDSLNTAIDNSDTLTPDQLHSGKEARRLIGPIDGS